MNRILALTFALLMINSVCSKNIEQKHLTCDQDNDCILIGTGSCCSRDTAINKSYAEEFKKSPKKICQQRRMFCPKTSAVCSNNKCKITTKDL